MFASHFYAISHKLKAIYLDRSYCSKHSCWAVATVVSLEADAVRVRFNDWGAVVEEVVTRLDSANRLAPPNTIALDGMTA